MKLGKREIDALTCPPGQRDRIVFDDELRGFGVRVTVSGSKSFLFEYRRAGLKRRLLLGRYGDITPAQARKLAEAARGRVSAGGDPAAERAEEHEAARAAARAKRKAKTADALTLAVLIDQYETLHLAHRSARYGKEAARALRVALADLLDEPAHRIETAMVRRVLDAIPKPMKPKAGEKKSGEQLSSAPAIRGEAMARRVRAYGNALFEWAKSRELLTGNPFMRVTIASREVARERVLTEREIGEVWRAAGKLGWPWGSFFRFLMLTLQREAEVCGVTWPEIETDLSAWTLPGARTKNGKPHIVALAEPARAILRAVPRRDGVALVFTTTGRTPISGFSHGKARLDAAICAERAEIAKRAGGTAEALVPWRIHDFRRTGVSTLASLGVRQEVADKLLNHATGIIQGVAAIYQRYDYAPERRAALETWAEHVLNAATATTTPPASNAATEATPPASNVVPISEGRRRPRRGG